jgi:hypothetical protein
MFGAPAAPSYRPNLDKVRAAQTMPWEPSQLSRYRLIFQQTTLWLPDDEAAQYRFAFDAEMDRLQPPDPG